MSLCVYSAIMGDVRDIVRPTPKQPSGSPVTDFFLFVDSGSSLARQDAVIQGWNIVEVDKPKQEDWWTPVRMARFVKIMFPLPESNLYDKFLWLDGSFQLKAWPGDFLQPYLQHEMTYFTHSERSTLDAELRACIYHRKDEPAKMQSQFQRYMAEGYSGLGLAETGILLRKNTPAVRRFNEFWWNEIKHGSHRDQLSFGYSLWKSPVDTGTFPETVYENPFVHFFHHRRR